MKRIVLAFVVLAVASLLPGTAHAQDHDFNHIQLGVYADYFNLQQTHTNFGGVGARLGVNATPWAMIEAEMNYDFTQPFTETFDNGVTLGTNRTDVRLLHGLFGPKFQTPGPLKFFVTVKGGFTDFMLDSRPVTFDTFTSSVEGLRSNNWNGVFYPGVGVEGRIGPVGLRLDAGDEIYYNHGPHHNLRIAFGPVIQF